MTKEALKLALEALNDMACWQEGREVDMGFDEPYAADTSRKAITAIKEALAQPKEPEPEPVAWEQFYPDIGKPQIAINPEIVGYVAPQRTWVGLTQTQVKLLWEGVREEAIKSGDSLNWVFYTHINEALKQKNTRGQE